jgi:hypothetical protein
MGSHVDDAIVLHHSGGVNNGEIPDLRASMDDCLGQDSNPLP